MGSIILSRTAQRDVQRGREASATIRDQIQEARAQGYEVIEVRVSEHVANLMRAFFAVTFNEFDGVLPNQVLGVPFVIGGTGGRDYEMRKKRLQ